jgi:hypothetical protein
MSLCVLCGEPWQQRHECNRLALQAALTTLFAHTNVNYTVEQWRDLCNSANGLVKARTVQRLETEGLG